MIRIENLCKYYAGNAVVNNISVTFPQKKMTALIGPNGAGKSTLLMILAKLLDPSDGNVWLNQKNTDDYSPRQFAQLVATLRQSQEIHQRLRVEELVAFGRFPYSRGRLTKMDRVAIDRALEYLSLTSLRGSNLHEISGGQRQLALLALVIAQETDMLLLDEPLNNLDMKHSRQIMQALRELCDVDGRTIICVIHDINFAANYSDWILALKHGSVHSSGPVDSIITQKNLQCLYGINFDVVKTRNGYLCNYFNP